MNVHVTTWFSLALLIDGSFDEGIAGMDAQIAESNFSLLHYVEFCCHGLP